MPSERSLLLVEDESSIVELITYNFKREGYSVQSTADAEEALKIAVKSKPSMILLDLMLPQADGFDLCKMLRRDYKTQHIPIIMLTAKAQESDVVLGLEVGADDYLTKPFSVRQLLARVKAVLRRYENRSEDTILRTGDLELDLERYTVSLNDQRVLCTPKEFAILKFLMQSRERVHTREAIVENVWG